MSEMNLIKKLRLEHNLSLRELEEKSGVSVATLARLEAGGKALEKTLFALSKFYELDYAQFGGFVAINPKKDQGQPQTVAK